MTLSPVTPHIQNQTHLAAYLSQLNYSKFQLFLPLSLLLFMRERERGELNVEKGLWGIVERERIWNSEGKTETSKVGVKKRWRQLERKEETEEEREKSFYQVRAGNKYFSTLMNSRNVTGRKERTRSRE
ncbi:hypothetical protein AAC387_Pa08g1732 [Persea americana]